MSEEYQVLAITVKKFSKSAKDLTIADYEFYINWVHKTFQDVMIRQVYYEKDKQHQRLHFHGVVIVPKGFFRKKLQKKDFNVYVTDVYYSKGWNEYSTKDQKKQPEKKQPSMFSKVKKRPIEYEPTQDDLDQLAFYESELKSYEFPHDEFIVDLDTPVPI